jgi:membrane protease YdiL (CAAX protease family)
MRHPIVSGTIVVIGLTILVNACLQGDTLRAVVYLGSVLVGVALIEVVLVRWPAADAPVPVRNAAGELAVAAACFVAGFVWLYARFVVQSRPPPGIARLVWGAWLIGFVFNGALALVLLVRRYRLSELGLRITGLAAAPLVVGVFASAAWLFGHSHITWAMLVEESGGSTWTVIGTALLAAVPEEFFRFVWQTRAGAWLKNPAAGWLIAAIPWAVLHAPKDWDDSHALATTVMGVINILPIGLLWGYLTHRTRSLLPSVLLHATNVWGLQNLL